MDKQQEYVLRAIEERDISFIRLWFTDVSGQLKSVAIAPAEVESAFEEGIGFDGSAIEGLTRVFESDMLLAPDPSTFQMLPWRDGANGVARMFCDVLTPDGEPARPERITPVIIGNNVYVMMPMAGEDAASFKELMATSDTASAAFGQPLEIGSENVTVEDAPAYEVPEGK